MNALEGPPLTFTGNGPELQRCAQCGRLGVRGFTTFTNAEHRISITVCANKAACRKRWPKPARDDA
ncbi:hypothetical protein [Streptomyces sp. SCL15-4]|uniref:hypothetical protein n=1 Tax=Streptomyces sp. SCL15-4 TaxID=2967221 RepID=UPI002965D1C9|nr:hypothetical protein [Streptomyces sp. SCL15-4]